MIKFPTRYVPKTLKKVDQQKQVNMLLKSKKLYKKHQYYTRKKVSYPGKKSRHLKHAQNIYGIDNISPTSELAAKTGCSLSALKQIVRKGEGAYYSSGSRPNQTAQSWGLARLASSLTAGKSAAVDYKILNNGCNHTKKAFKLANKAKKKYNHGHSKTRKTNF